MDAPSRRRAGSCVGLVLAVAMLAASCGDDTDNDEPPTGSSWLHLGRDLGNSRAATAESVIGTDNVAALEPAWELSGVAGVTGTPIVADGVVYIGDWTGHIRALDAASGDERWKQHLESGQIAGAVAIDESRVFAGTSPEARLVALDRATGERVWDQRLDGHSTAGIVGSPVHADGLVIVGIASFENAVEGVEDFTFRGSVVALDAETGDEAWRYWTTTGDEREGPGVGVWSSPAVDTERGHVYFGTGQHYAGPASERSDAVIALDVTTGEEQWVHQYTAGDVWAVEAMGGPDADVSTPPNLFEVDGIEAVGAGDKAGVYKALERDTGEELWSQQATDGGLQGGIMASAAVADSTVFLASNRGSTNADLIALDTDTGDERWRSAVEGMVFGPVTWANGVLYLADNTGRISGFDADSGDRLWAHHVDERAASGVAVVDGTVFAGWGWPLDLLAPDLQGGLIAFRPGDPDDPDRPRDMDEADGDPDGAVVFQQSCAACHGGDGSGATAPGLLDIGDRLPVDQQQTIVRSGRGQMPAFSDALSPEAIDAVVDYINSGLAPDA